MFWTCIVFNQGDYTFAQQPSFKHTWRSMTASLSYIVETGARDATAHVETVPEVTAGSSTMAQSAICLA